MEIPFIDPTVAHVGVSKLRDLNAEALRELNKTLVVRDGDDPLAVVMTFDLWLIIQERFKTVSDHVS